MEDAVMVELAFTRTASEFACSHEYDFFAVYDGHGGSQVANACRERMHLIVAEEVARRWPMIESEFGRWENTMVESFRRLDAEVGGNKEPILYDRIEPDFRETVGSTALTVVVGKNRIIVANCGVSRAVLSRGGTTVALSSDHKPNRPDEMQRIEAAGGKVIESDGYRVWGVLNNSRSIGDHKLKAYVICEPEVTITERVLEDEFIILASDGLWDVISNEMACYIVRSCLLAGPTPTDVASLLVKIAISRGSRDNISVIVVQLSTAMQS
ncbi:Protein phosphatase 2C family protein [Rhynchospora pubera]|uniref:protein-serine/threonine phosphatase n=1 Tax=Rhynchospora pubera TaxID=906938 RepID=A0AAV8DNU8_9POAL|nr:Protein phosphatase 2C family protein [Rhynchospora pubera]